MKRILLLTALLLFSVMGFSQNVYKASNFGIKIEGTQVSSIKTFEALYDFVYERLK